MGKREIDPKSRDYEFSEIEPDERFVQTAKEFWVTIGTFCVFTVLMIMNLYMMNGPDPQHYTYVFGFPLWIFCQFCLLIGMVVAVILITTFVYRDMDITEHGTVKPREKK